MESAEDAGTRGADGALDAAATRLERALAVLEQRA